jgi:hypothetical protein
VSEAGADASQTAGHRRAYPPTTRAYPRDEVGQMLARIAWRFGRACAERSNFAGLLTVSSLQGTPTTPFKVHQLRLTHKMLQPEWCRLCFAI